MKKSTEDELRKEIAHLKRIITTLVAWIAESAVSPLSQQEAKELIEMIEKE
jgi:hypothetical protein